jgi:hypothetical protein
MADERGNMEEDQGRAAVTVLVDERGVVTDVGIPAGWHRAMRPRELGPALLAAANTAIANRVAEQVELVDLDDPAPVFTTRDAPSADGDPTSAVAEDLVTEVLDLFSRYDAELATYAAQVRAATTTTNRGESGSGRVVVMFASGQVSAVDIDTTWAAGARHTEIRSEVLSAFQAAQRQARSATIPLPPSIARLQELASDPQALSRQLGLAR